MIMSLGFLFFVFCFVFVSSTNDRDGCISFWMKLEANSALWKPKLWAWSILGFKAEATSGSLAIPMEVLSTASTLTTSLKLSMLINGQATWNIGNCSLSLSLAHTQDELLTYTHLIESLLKLRTLYQTNRYYFTDAFDTLHRLLVEEGSWICPYWSSCYWSGTGRFTYWDFANFQPGVDPNVFNVPTLCTLPSGSIMDFPGNTYINSWTFSAEKYLCTDSELVATTTTTKKRTKKRKAWTEKLK